LELAIVVAIIGLLAAAMLNRMPFYQEQAEKTAMEQMVGTLRSALHLQASGLFAKGRTDDIPRLMTQNPMTWFAETLANYKGEYFAPKPQDIEPGTWYYDLKSGGWSIWFATTNTFVSSPAIQAKCISGHGWSPALMKTIKRTIKPLKGRCPNR
jgi:type II secretory pathway pseudopilin PulG